MSLLTALLPYEGADTDSGYDDHEYEVNQRASSPSRLLEQSFARANVPICEASPRRIRHLAAFRAG